MRTSNSGGRLRDPRGRHRRQPEDLDGISAAAAAAGRARRRRSSPRAAGGVRARATTLRSSSGPTSTPDHPRSAVRTRRSSRRTRSSRRSDVRFWRTPFRSMPSRSDRSSRSGAADREVRRAGFYFKPSRRHVARPTQRGDDGRATAPVRRARLHSSDEACPLRAQPDGLAPCRQRAQRGDQSPGGRPLPPADRRHGPCAKRRGRGGGDPRRPRMARHLLGRGPGTPERAAGALPRGCRAARRRSLRPDDAAPRGRDGHLPPRERRRRRRARGSRTSTAGTTTARTKTCTAGSTRRSGRPRRSTSTTA